MASAQLDKLWDGWMKSMSESYATTVDLLENNKAEAAAEEFAQRFVPPLKKLYSEAGQTYPIRFSKASAWCEWTKSLYIQARRTQEQLKQGDAEAAKESLAAIRGHLYNLHAETGTRKSNDYIYAFQREVEKKPADAKLLARLRESLASAKPSDKAAAHPEAFEASKAAWDLRAQKIDGAKLGTLQRRKLRKATAELYREFGIQFQ